MQHKDRGYWSDEYHIRKAKASEYYDKKIVFDDPSAPNPIHSFVYKRLVRKAAKAYHKWKGFLPFNPKDIYDLQVFLNLLAVTSCAGKADAEISAEMLQKSVDFYKKHGRDYPEGK